MCLPYCRIDTKFTNSPNQIQCNSISYCRFWNPETERACKVKWFLIRIILIPEIWKCSMNPITWNGDQTLLCVWAKSDQPIRHKVKLITSSHLLLCFYSRCRWGNMCIILFCQERGPWKLIHLVIPLCCSVFTTLFKFWTLGGVPQFNKSIQDNVTLLTIAYVWVGAILGCIALVFFVFGLNEDEDYLRIYHGLWHFFAGLAIYFIYHSKERRKNKLP